MANWIKKDDMFVCSNCYTTAPYSTKDGIIEYWPKLEYCPNCGCKMDEEIPFYWLNRRSRIKKWEEKIKKQNSLSGKDFSILIQDLLIPDGTYVIDVGNYENVNLVCAEHMLNTCKKHPILWKLFFMM